VERVKRSEVSPGPPHTRGRMGPKGQTVPAFPRLTLYAVLMLSGLAIAVLVAPTAAGADSVAGAAVITHPYQTTPLDGGG
jgi:hypothetical protein